MVITKSDRLILRDLEDFDLESFFRYRSNKELLKFQEFSLSSLDETKQFIKAQKDITIGQKGEWKQIGIALLDDTLIGDCAIQFTPEENRIAEIGCTIQTNYHNKGYATEALAKLISYTFEHYPIHKFKALVDIRNIPSQKMLEKIGFEKEAHFKLHYWDKNDEEWVDELLYGLLRNS